MLPPTIPTRKVGARPYTNWVNTSSPKVVVPNQNSLDGGTDDGPTKSAGLYGVMEGPMIINTMKISRTVSPIRSLVFRKAKYKSSFFFFILRLPAYQPAC